MRSQPKPPEQRQRRGKDDVGALPDDVVPNPPPPPKGMLAESVARWEQYWASPLAWTNRQDVELDQLERLFLLRDTMLRFLRRVRSRPTTKGSTGQLRPNPLSSQVTALAAEVRQLEDRLGFGLTARKALGIHFPDPQRAGAGLPEPPDPTAPAANDDYDLEDDPRVVALRP